MCGAFESIYQQQRSFHTFLFKFEQNHFSSYNILRLNSEVKMKKITKREREVDVVVTQVHETVNKR